MRLIVVSLTLVISRIFLYLNPRTTASRNTSLGMPTQAPAALTTELPSPSRRSWSHDPSFSKSAYGDWTKLSLKQTQREKGPIAYEVYCNMYNILHHIKSLLIRRGLLFAPHWTTHPLNNVQASTLRILFGIAFTWPAGSFRRLG